MAQQSKFKTAHEERNNENTQTNAFNAYATS
ncbi:MAG: hypothetical protein UR51_C0009G0010 [Candidatus Moranbacteria bacterium GW2011_GWF1_34_10]|nr:MAG: hypothetical protein UR51_C0009G0010 [Candidatus Moranbacteria bacterium GW2011_GWF1_34_10]